MKATERSSRRNSQSTGPGISLFPFLAVLICTMGALVPLLLAISRTARLQAESAALAQAAEQGAELKTQHEDVCWRMEQLKKSHASSEKQLADARLQLGHIEDHARRLRGQLAQYQTTIADLQRTEGDERQRLGQPQAELEQVRTQIATAKQQLAQAEQGAAGRNRCYAVIPYEGPNQTHRRPVYLECREDSVVLQPEGIELVAEDFEGPLGPGNPLAAALRATREYMLSNREFDAQAGDPYPMLLVRPEGITAYYAARAAMKSWGFGFGYELVDGSWKLAYPPPDPRLAETVRQVVASARASQARLAAAAPRHYPSRTKAAYRAAPGSGYIREGAPAGDDDRGYGSDGDAGSTGAGGMARRGGQAVAGGGSAAFGTTSPSGETGGVASNGNAGPALSGNGTSVGSYPAYGAQRAADGVLDATQGSPGTVTGQSAQGGSATSQGGPAAQAFGSGGGTETSQGSSSANPVSAGGKIERPEGYVVGQPPREHIAQKPPASSDAVQRARMPGPGEWEPAPERPPKREEKDDEPQHVGRHSKSLAEKRGADWGLRNAARGSVGVTRPIRVECYADRLVLVSDREPVNNKVIALGPRTDASINMLISSVWERMDEWGMAGRGMFWRPLLEVYVAPDANQRFAELAMLLAGSGVMVERK